MPKIPQAPRLLFIAPLPPPNGGVAHISEMIFKSTLAEEYEVILINTSKPNEIRERVGRIGITSFYYPLVIWMRLVVQLVRFRPKIVYVVCSSDYSYLREAILMLTARLGRASVVAHFHGRRRGFLFGGRFGITDLILRATVPLFDKMIFLSRGLQLSLVNAFGAEKGEVVSNFVDLRLMPLPRLNERKGNQIVFVGRLSKAKGMFELIEAMALLARNGVPAFLHLIGIGETKDEEEAIRAFVHSKGLDGMVQFHGRVTGLEKGELMARSDIFVLPSRSEIFPVTIVEAFAAALPVVSTTTGAIPEMVSEGTNGFLVHPGDAHALSEKLRLLLENKQLRTRIAESNFLLARTNYSKESAIAHITQILKSVGPPCRN
jgi:glycosyltransferase involved in cell wall biosynthesis